MDQSTPQPKRFALGVDYGSNSVRALIVDIADGSEIATSVYDYPSGEHGILLDPRNPHLARQNPADYINGFYTSVRNAITAANKTKGFAPDRVVGIGVDTTGSTPIPMDRNGMPLALDKRFSGHLAAQAWLWKDHTGHAEAAEISAAAAKHRDKVLSKCGGVYSSEWYWSKILQCKRADKKVFKAAYVWVELADFIPAFITGTTSPDEIKRGICAAGHKALYHEQWGGMPRASLLKKLDPDLVPLSERFAHKPVDSSNKAGELTAAVAKKVGLPAGIAVAVGAFDAHHGAVGAGVKPGTLVKIMGTSTCDITVWPLNENLPDIPGLCGIVPGSVQPGMYGLEAGQSAVGDIFNWFVRYLAPSEFTAKGDAHANLSRAAEELKPGASGLLALDWNNGNRTVLVDQLLTGLMVGQTLHTTAPEMYRALVEATAFGALTIINRFEQYGVKIREVINCGGIAEKNPFVMQVYADVCNRPMKVSRSAQTCALGAAIFGAVASGAYQTVGEAQQKMTGVKTKVYRPRKKAAAIYAELYKLYLQLHDAFGTSQYPGTLDQVMKDLIALRDRQNNGKQHV